MTIVMSCNCCAWSVPHSSSSGLRLRLLPLPFPLEFDFGIDLRLWLHLSGVANVIWILAGFLLCPQSGLWAVVVVVIWKIALRSSSFWFVSIWRNHFMVSLSIRIPETWSKVGPRNCWNYCGTNCHSEAISESNRIQSVLWLIRMSTKFRWQRFSKLPWLGSDCRLYAYAYGYAYGYGFGQSWL